MTWFFLALGSAAAWTLVALFQKDCSLGENAIQTAAATSILWAALSLLFIPFIKLPSGLYLWTLLTLAGVVYGIAYYYSAKAFKYLKVSIASPMYNIGTVIAVLMAVLILGEKLTYPQIAGVILVILGTYILELKKGSPFLQPFRDIFKSEKIHYVLISTLAYSVVTILSKYILNFIDPLTFLFTQLFLSGLFIAILVYWKHGGFKDIRKGFVVHKHMIVVLSVTMIVAMLTDFFALRAGEASLVLPVVRLWTLFVVIFGGTFYKEGHLRNRIIATAIMLAGIFIIYL
jgi:drug/metabolite transporter (DMT)-like permease